MEGVESIFDSPPLCHTMEGFQILNIEQRFTYPNGIAFIRGVLFWGGLFTVMFSVYL